MRIGRFSALGYLNTEYTMTGRSFALGQREISYGTVKRLSSTHRISASDPVKWLNASKCGEVCATCPQVTNCINVTRPTTFFTPVHWSLWAVLGVLGAASAWAIAYPKSLVKMYVDEAYFPPDERDAIYRDIAQRMGVRHVDKILFLETENYGPTSVGSDSPRGGVVFIPHSLAVSALSPHQHTDEERALLLEQEGELHPLTEELEFIIGHEITHLLKNHAGHTAAVSALAALSATALIKGYNAVLWKSKRFGGMVVHSKGMFVALVIAAMASTSFTQSWLQEFEADWESAERLRLEDVAVRLKRKQVRQNQVVRAKYGDQSISESGNELYHLEHPPATMQLQNLERLQNMRNRD